jgi:DNA invertase Pin-like site-specific DNA recombinase
MTRTLIRRPRRERATTRTLGYTSVPTDFALDGPEVRAQRLAIESACEELGLKLVDVVTDHEPDDPSERPGLSYVFEHLGAGTASCVIVSDLERLSRDVDELAALIDRLAREEVRLIVLDVGLDTATPSGRVAIAPAGTPPGDPVPAVAEAPAGTASEPSLPATRTADRALGYASIPANAGGGRELDEQKKAIERDAARLGLELLEVVREREPARGKALDRAGLSYLIGRIAAGEATCIVVSSLDHLSRSVAELGTIVQWLERNGVRMVAADLELDTATPGGKTTARTLASVAGWERERLSERTAKGLAAARAKRRVAGGQSGTDWNAIKRRIARMRADGMTLQAIADVLNEEGVPTQRGAAKWRTSSVQTAAGYKRRVRSSKLDDLPPVARGDTTPDTEQPS